MPAHIVKPRNYSNSRLWQGVPQMALENIRQYDAAYQGYTFIFVTHTPRFLDGIPLGRFHMENLKTIIEKANTGFSGPQSKVGNFVDQTDGYSNRKISHMVSVTKDIDEISLTLHEFRGLPVKQALEFWMDGVIDEKGQNGNYYGLVEDLEWSLYNHTMGILVVQTDPSFYYIQEAAYYQNLMPAEVNFDWFNYTKGDVSIIDNQDIRFKANEERSDFVNEIAVEYMNEYILKNIDKYFNRHNYDPRIPTPS